MSRLTQLKQELNSHPLVVQGKQRYDQLEPREQMVLRYGGIALAVLLLINSVLLPAWQLSVKRQKAMLAEHETLSWMLEQSAQLPPPAPLPSPDESLEQVIQRLAVENGITLGRVNEVQGLVRLNLKAVPLSSLIRWLAALEAEQGVIIVSADIARQTGGEQASARLQLRDPRQ